MLFDIDIRGMMLLTNHGVLEQGDIRLVLVGHGYEPVEQNPQAFAARCASNWRPCRDVEITRDDLTALMKTKRMELDGVTVTLDASVARLTGKTAPG